VQPAEELDSNVISVTTPAAAGAPPGYGGMPPQGAVPPYEDIINNDGSGLLYNETETELSRGYTKLGFIGYSHGVGIMGNFALKLVNDPQTPISTTVVFVGTIDGVEYGNGPDSASPPLNGWYVGIGAPVTLSPAIIWQGCIGDNYWEPNGWLTPKGIIYLSINGANMVGATNHEIDFLNHSQIGTSSGVLTAIENATDEAY
jgi:hypothetical protein